MVYPAAVTPFTSTGEIDMPGLVRLCARFRSEGCTGVLVGGTTGEGPSLSAIEKRDLVRALVPAAGGLPVILGIATPSLPEAQWLVQQAGKAGAEACLVMPPAFFREATEPALGDWFEAVMDAATVPVLAYNFPQRTGIALSSGLIERLARHPQMGGVKDSSGDAINLDAFARVAPGKRLFVGAEPLLVAARQAGWSGTMSGAANVLGRWLVAVNRDFDQSVAAAEAKMTVILPALTALRGAPQPATHKAILVALGALDRAGVRLPLEPVDLDDPSSLAARAWSQVAPLLGMRPEAN